MCCRPRGLAQLAMMLIEEPTKGVTAVAQQMPAVQDLGGVRRAPGGAVGIGAGAVTDDGGTAAKLGELCWAGYDRPVTSAAGD